MKFKILNKHEAEIDQETEKHILIGIRTEDTNKVNYLPNPNRLDQILLTFVDLDDEASSKKFYIIGKRYEERFILFNEDHANKILDFFLKYKDKVDLLLVHCDMGQSRSPGVAAALAKICGQSDEIFFKTKTPNMKVYRTLLNKAVERGLL